MSAEIDVKRLVKEHFGKRAKFYATGIFADEKHLQDFVTLAKPKAGDIALDVACGAGLLAFAFAPLVKQVIGIDLTPALLELAKASLAELKLENVEFRLGDAENLDFADLCFDVVSCRLSFHHFPHPLTALSEFHRVLKPGGRLVLRDVTTSEDATKATAHNKFEKVCDPSHVRMYSVSELLDMLAGAGFKEATHSLMPHDWPAKDIADPDLSELDSETKIRARALLEESMATDRFGLNVRFEGKQMVFTYQAATFCAVR